MTDENRIRLSALSRMHDDVEDCGFTYSDDEIEGEEDADVENQYYNSKGIPTSQLKILLSSSKPPRLAQHCWKKKSLHARWMAFQRLFLWKRRKANGGSKP